MNPVNLILGCFEFLALLPQIEPILPLWIGPRVHYVKHVLGRIFMIATYPCAARFKVVQKRPGLFANRSIVDRLSAPCQEKELVKLLKEDGTGLVDCTEYGLSVPRQFAQEGANSPRALRIETT